jgi:hypothetical protein
MSKQPRKKAPDVEDKQPRTKAPDEADIDPSTYPTSADLSRADLRVLHHFCKDTAVVEFGCGGSTLFLQKIAKTLTSYDTSQEWIDLVKGQLSGNRQEIILIDAVPPILPKADVHFVDGIDHLRPIWVRYCQEQRAAKVIIVHDSRRTYPVAGLGCLFEWPLTALIEKVEYHYMGSNCLVITLRQTPVAYEDWNVTEPVNRLPHLHKTPGKP